MESTRGAKGSSSKDSSSKGSAQNSAKTKFTSKTKPLRSPAEGASKESLPSSPTSPGPSNLSDPKTSFNAAEPSSKTSSKVADASWEISSKAEVSPSPSEELDGSDDSNSPEMPPADGPDSSTPPPKDNASANGHRPYQVLYVSDIDHVSREEHLWHVFGPWADGIRSIRLIRYVGKPYSLTHAYVNFTNHRDAKHAFENVQPLFVNSSYCRVVPYDGDTLKRPERFDQNGGAGIFVQNLDVQITASMLWGFFVNFGTILGCRVAIDEYGVPRGFAYVTYSTPEQASEAIKKMDGQLIGRRRVAVKRNLPKDQRGVRIFIKFDANGSKQIPRDEDVQEALKEFASLEAVSIPKDPAGVPRGFALATFREPADASRAMEEVKEIAGIPVFLDVATGAGYHLHSPLERSPPYSLEALNPALGATMAPAMGQNAGPVMLSVPTPLSNGMAAPHAPRLVANSLSTHKISSTNLFVRPLPSEIREEDLLEEFRKYGNITSAKVILHPEGFSRGFGFVSFGSPDHARHAIEELNGAERWGQQLFVAPAQSKRKPHPRLTLHHSALNHPMASPLPPFAGLYYIPMEYAYDYSSFAATAALSMATPAAMLPPPLSAQGGLAHLESSSVEELGEWLHPCVVQHRTIGGNFDLASRITGLLLQQPKRDIVSWLENPPLMELRIQQGYDAYQEWFTSQNCA